MTVLLSTLLGGIGLFLVGMVLLTDGLKAISGEALRRMLVHFTGRPFKAFVSGAVATLLVQSSSATTVTVIGLVSAGLLTFPQAVGVVLGASLGTTGTSWIVSLLGLKVDIGLYALPLVGVGALMKLLVRGKGDSIGMALAGFGLIFVGIHTLQGGMEGLAHKFDLRAVPSAGFFSHLLMLLIGVAMTVVMQSSSAAVATTLTAMHSDLLTFDQAASVVIGASIGTTVTSSLAAIGASVPAKRTALAHVLFNLLTGLIALVLLPLFLGGIEAVQRSTGLTTGPTSLAAFHTAFVLTGVAIFLPFASQFSRMIERLLPDKSPALTRHLDDSVLGVPPVALEASRRTLAEIASELIRTARARLDDHREHAETAQSWQFHQALEQAQDFLARIPPLPPREPMAQSRVAQMHAVDHLVRLLSHIRPPRPFRTLGATEHLQPLLQQTRQTLELAETGLRGATPPDWLEGVEMNSRKAAELRRRERLTLLEQTATADWEPARVLAVLDAMRWLDRIAYHTWRICNYLGNRAEANGSQIDPRADEFEPAEQPP